MFRPAAQDAALSFKLKVAPLPESNVMALAAELETKNDRVETGKASSHWNFTEAECLIRSHQFHVAPVFVFERLGTFLVQFCQIWKWLCKNHRQQAGAQGLFFFNHPSRLPQDSDMWKSSVLWLVSMILQLEDDSCHATTAIHVSSASRFVTVFPCYYVHRLENSSKSLLLSHRIDDFITRSKRPQVRVIVQERVFRGSIKPSCCEILQRMSWKCDANDWHRSKINLFSGLPLAPTIRAVPQTESNSRNSPEQGWVHLEDKPVNREKLYIDKIK